MPTPTPNFTAQLALTNPSPVNPGSVPGSALLQALVNTIPLDEAVAVTTVANSGQAIQGASLATKSLGTPAAPTVTPAGTVGATSYSYKVVAKSGLRTTAASAAGSTSTGNATLTAINNNGIVFTCVPYATSYDIYRTVGGSTQGLIGNVPQPASVVAAFPTSVSYASTVITASFTDTGLTADGSTPPTVNLTGNMQPDVHDDIYIPALGTPYNLVIGVNGTAGTTSYSYVISAVSTVGEAPCTAVQTNTGNATLTSTNSLLLTWNQVPGAQMYRIYRSATSGTPNTTGLIGTVNSTGAATYSFTDTGLAIITAAVPTNNTTGSILASGNIFANNLLVSGPAPSVNATAGNANLTVANMLTNVLLRSGSTTPADTTPTAAAIINGLRSVNAAGNTQSVQAGQGWYWFVRNANSGTLTLGQAATGITWAAAQTNTVATVSGHLFYIALTNVTPGSEAITIYSIIGSVAY